MEPMQSDRIPEPSAAQLSRGLAAERAGRYAEAVEAYREAARLDPGDIDAQVRLGLVLRVLGRDEEANEAFRLALDMRAEHDE
jgi:Flp pilus assembly protein TadD